MPELGSLGSVRGALRNERPYRECEKSPLGRKVRIPRQSGQGFRFDVGHRSDLIPATIPK